MKSLQYRAIPAGSPGGGYVGRAIPADQATRLGAQAVVTGGNKVVGVLHIQGSNDKAPPGTVLSGYVPRNWSDITTVTVTTPEGAGGNPGGSALIPCVEICCEWVRAVWTETSALASGSVEATVVLMAAGG